MVSTSRQQDLEHQREVGARVGVLAHWSHARAELRERDLEPVLWIPCGHGRDPLLGGRAQADGDAFAVLPAEMNAPGAVLPRIGSPGLLGAEVIHGNRQVVGAKADAKLLVRQNPIFRLTLRCAAHG